MDWKIKGSPSQIILDNQIYRKAGEVATLMNEYFITKVKNLQSGFTGQNIDLSGCHSAMASKSCSLDLGYVSLKTVERIIMNLKSSKAVAVDELDSFSLKMSAKIISAPVHHLVTLSLMQQKFPTSWKYAKVLPLHKKRL